MSEFDFYGTLNTVNHMKGWNYIRVLGGVIISLEH